MGSVRYCVDYMMACLLRESRNDPTPLPSTPHELPGKLSHTPQSSCRLAATTLDHLRSTTVSLHLALSHLTDTHPLRNIFLSDNTNAQRQDFLNPLRYPFSRVNTAPLDDLLYRFSTRIPPMRTFVTPLNPLTWHGF